ncbi:fasciclin domain-containing protein [Microvirga massiliensis]|uniref:fasciclin domain-containing protein n=1 Tax=Microvirga massiliensis TaxID=1033741 RepID=UPI00062B83A3|nr:fasciclin domain-containing protein [Microvirga massiliensis]
MSIKRNLLAAVAGLALASPVAAADIVETASSNGSFTTLVAAVKAAGLVDTLKGQGPFTVFAPTDEAFKKLPPGTVENLLKPENRAQLTRILTYHVVPGKVMAGDVKGKRTTATTVEGSAVAIDASGQAVKVDNATVRQADVTASNGVIHVIDTVIMPKS